MDIQQQERFLEEIGGEPLKGSGFEDETSAFDDETESGVDHQEDEQ